MKHSPYGPSGAHRYINCSGSVALCAKLPPQETTVYALEGQTSHKLGELVLKRLTENKSLMEVEDVEAVVTAEIGSLGRHSAHLTEEAIPAVVEYVKCIQKQLRLLDIMSERVSFGFEQTINLDWLIPNIWGTADAYIECEIEGVKNVYIYDFKFGAGVPVDVHNNPQLRLYALGTIGKGADPDTKVFVTVIQPRIDHPEGICRSEECTAGELYKWAKKVVVPAVKRSQEKDPPFACGDWCRFCGAQGICPQRKKEIVAVLKADVSKSEITLPPVESLTDDEVVKIFNFTKIINPWIDKVKDNLEARLKAGEKVKGLKLVAGKGSRDWKDGDEAQKVLTKLLSKKAFTEPKLKSVAQIEKEIKTLGDDIKGKVSTLWGKKDGSPIVALADDPRQELKALQRRIYFWRSLTFLINGGIIEWFPR